MADLTDILNSKGTSHGVQGNTVLPLDDSQHLWFVQEGCIDVFAVPRGIEERPAARIYICRAEQGQLLCGCESSDTHLPSLIAVGHPGSRVLQVERSDLDEVLTDESHAAEFQPLLENWIDELTTVVTRRRLPANAALLEPNRDAEFHAGVAVSPAHGVSWLVAADGEPRFLGRLEIPLPTANGAFPISASGWVEFSERTRLTSASTESLLSNGGLWSGLQQFHEVILQGLAENAQQSAASDWQRLDAKARAEHRLAESALSQLAAAAIGDGETAVAGADDPLLAACRMIGDHKCVSIVAPANYAEQTWSDPVGVIARASALRIRRVVLSGHWWQQDNGPLLAFLKENNQPVALLPTSSTSYEIVNPATQHRDEVTAQTASRIKAFGYTFYRSFPPEPLSLRDIVRFGLQGTRKDWLRLVGLGIAAGVLGLLIPASTGWIIGNVIPGAERSQLLLIVLALTVTAAVAVLFEFVQGIAMLRVETRMDSTLEAAVWDRLLNLPASFFRKYTAGDLAMRAMGISYIRQAFTQSATSSLLTFASSIVYFALLFYYDSGLAILATLIFIVIVVATIIAIYYQLPHERQQQHNRGRVWGIVLQLFTGISRLRVAGAENRALAYWARNYSRQTKSSIRSQMVANHLESFMSSLPALAPLVIFTSVVLFPREDFSVATFLAFNVAFVEIVTAAMTTSGTLSSVLEVVPLFERAAPILETRPEYDRAKRDPGELTGEIEINHVSFRYARDAPLVLDDASLHIRPGEFVAFVGPSGAGKSTILRLLLGFETPNSGSIYYDREDLAGLDQLAVRRQIGVVLQDSRITPGDIFSNIVGSAPLTHDDAWEAARLSGLDEDIKQMPMGMYTFLSEGESTLSGGQKQRLLIARAIVKKPKILLFDEATSALDNVTQAKVAESLDNLKATRIVVAHRLSTIINADRIYVIHQGNIVQQGTYKELDEQSGLFRDLVKRQLV